MPAKTNENIKRYLVIALMGVAGVVAYFQFFHQTGSQTTTIAEPAAGAVPHAIPSVKTDDQSIAQQPDRKRGPFMVSNIRDIFEPPPIPPGLREQIQEREQRQGASKKMPADIPLALTGTIIGGKKPMAIINEKFVRLGESVDIFKVTRITANEVVLEAGSHQRILKVLKAEERLGQ